MSQEKTRTQLLLELQEAQERVSRLQEQLRQQKSGAQFSLPNRSLQTILDSIPADIYVADMQSYEILFMNAQMQESFGRDCTGEICWQAFRAENGPCKHCTNQELLNAQGEPTGIKSWEGYNPVNGKWYLNYDRAVPWIDGRYVRIQIAVDITRRMQNEDALRNSEAFLDTLLNAIPLPVYYKDTKGRYLGFNRSFQEFFGQSRQQLIQNTVYDIFPPQSAAFYAQKDKELLQSGAIQQFETKTENVRGETRHIIYNKAVFFDWQGEPGGLIGALQDITEQKKIEEELRLHSLTLNQITDLVTVTDMQGYITYVNDAECRMLGYSRGQLLGRHVSSFGEDSSRGATQEEITRKTMEDGTWRGEVVNFCADGSAVILDCRTHIVRDESGKPIALCGISTDITERKQMEEFLLESEKRFRTVLNELPGGVFVHDLDGRILLVNEAASKNTGYTKEELLAMSVTEIDPGIVTRDDRSRLWQRLNLAESSTIESTHIRKDGSNYPAEIHLTAITLHGQEAILPIAFDITERKLAEDFLRESEQKYRKLIETSSSGYWELDADEITVNVNQALCSMLGYTRQEMLGSTPFDFVDAQNAQIFKQNIARTVSEIHRNYEITLQKKDGSPLYASFYATILLNKDNRVTGSFAFVVDLTQRVLVEKSTLEAKQQAEAANRAKSEFLANMSHEIRTPLNGIIGMLQVMQTTDLDEEQQEYVEMAFRSSKRLTRLLSDILDLSRIEAERMEIKAEEFRLAEIMQSIEDIFSQVAARNKNNLNINWDQSIPQRLIGDNTRLTQILFNLTGNALKYTRQGEINVQADLVSSTVTGNCRILFSISDNGAGIPENKLDQIFDIFTQANSSGSPYTRQHEGAGLGLPLVKRLIKLMGGNACIVSQENEGTAVYVSLPFDIPQALEGRTEEIGAKKGPQLHSSRILIADDDRTTQLHLTRLLQKMGFSVAVAEDGEKALVALAEEEFDCLLLDVQMPVMDGLETTRAIRNSQSGFRNIPIIALTAYAMSGDKEKFLQAGMDDYIAKPVDREELIQILNRNLQSKMDNHL